jgi:predicted kinase
MKKFKSNIFIIGGPNGAGKTTITRTVIADTLGIAEFVDADLIAQGLSGFDPQRAAPPAKHAAHPAPTPQVAPALPESAMRHRRLVTEPRSA